MKRSNTVMLAAFSVLLIAFFSTISLAEGESNLMFKGDLISVNPDSHSLVVRDSQNKEMKFSYNDKTEILGAGGTIEGLAGKSGTAVTVHYTKDGEASLATKIEVNPKAAY